MGISSADLFKLGYSINEKGKAVKVGKQVKQEPPKVKKKVPTGNEYKSHIEWVLVGSGFTYEKEILFHPTRKWRFDYAIPELKIFIEYNGIMSDKSGHTTIKGYSDNMEKYNAATCLGWRGLFYTPLNYKRVNEELKQLISIG